MQIKKGFTLVELLVVIGILAVLLTITLVAINPQRQIAQSNNTKRQADVNTILNAITQSIADNRGTVPTGITTSTLEISDTGANICSALVPRYVAALPVDPQVNNGTSVINCAVAYTTGYTVVQSATDNRITVAAISPELGEVISVTR